MTRPGALRKHVLATAFGLAAIGFDGASRASRAQALDDALAHLTPIADLRWRYETVAQVPLRVDAVAETLRARLGFSTGQVWSTSLLAEGGFVAPIVDDYRADPAVANRLQYPIVADPRNHVLNRLTLSNMSIPDTTLTIGRQRITLDDERFIGNVGWRQTEQTFDGLRIVNETIPGLTFDLSYIDRVHRVFGRDSPQGTYVGEVYLGNIGYDTDIGKLTGFAYLLSFNPITSFPGLPGTAAAALNPALSSTSTYGARFIGARDHKAFKLGYVFSYALQRERGDNPLRFRNAYYFAELSVTIRSLAIGAGDEVMQGDGAIGFATPLATTHRFDGWADKFLSTPANGLNNSYGMLTYRWRNVGPLHSLSASAIYRRFAAQHVRVDYGSEWDSQITASWRRFTAAVFYADYSAAASTPTAIARDTRKLVAQIEFIW